jgi:hypothetical protein
MVCVAAFIILCLLSIFIAIVSIFRRDIGKRYGKTFKKAWGCVGKRVTFQKCETNFKEDIKNSILKKFIVRKPKLVKPISIGIEIAAVLIVIITVWSLVVAAKSGLSLWALGTCDVVRPSACTLGTEFCSIDHQEPQNIVEAVGQWFANWGEIFAAIPDKFRSWNAEDFPLHGFYANNLDHDRPIAIDIIDPGCIVCLQSFRNQVSSNFFNDYKTLIVPFPIQKPDGSYLFRNSGIIVRYTLAVAYYDPSYSFRILEKLFNDYSENNIIYQAVFNDHIDETEAEELLQAWLIEFGLAKHELLRVVDIAHSEEIAAQIATNRNIVENDINVRGIPTMIYDGRRLTGLFRAD